MRIVVVCAVVGGMGCACWGPKPVPSQGGADFTKISFPLVRPLDGGLLVTPVQVGSDWYLFELDPLAARTRIDGDVVAHGSDDETAQVRLTAGGVETLVDADLMDVRLVPRDGFDIMGVLGRDVLRDELVFGVDRDAGIAWLAGRDAFVPPPAIKPVPYLSSDRGVEVFGEIDGERRYMRADFADPTARRRRGDMVDSEVATILDSGMTPADLTHPANVQAFGIERPALPVSDYHGHDAEVVLGAAFFAPYDFALDRAHDELYLAPRDTKKSTAATRIGRWGGTPCEHLGCVEVSVAPPDATSAQPKLDVHRDKASSMIALEVTLVAIGLPDAPRLRVGLPADVTGWRVPIDARYAGHTLVVADMSPFPKPCTAASGASCVYVDEVARPR